MNLARLNHILIPDTKAGRDRFRDSRLGHLVRPLGNVYRSLTGEGQFLSIFWFVCGAAGLEVGGTQIYILWCAVTGLLVGSLLIRRAYKLEGVRVHVEAPERLIAGDVGSFVFRLTSDREDDVVAIRAIRPLLPWDGKYVGDRPGLARLPAGGVASFAARARFTHRGEHHLDPFYLARVVSLGVSMGPAIQTDGVHFLVVPRPAVVTSLAMPMAARFQPGGTSIRGQTGESREFVGIRPYRPGDAVRDLHARSWARTGYPVVREYRQEYFTRVGVVLDTDATTAGERIQEAGISLCAGVLEHVSRGEALIDLLVVGDRVHRLAMGHLAAGAHGGVLGHIDQAHELLACLEPGPVLDPSGLSGALNEHLSQLSCVVFVMLAWDEPRRRVVDQVRQAGCAAVALVVSELPLEHAGATAVAPAAIEKQEALQL